MTHPLTRSGNTHRYGPWIIEAADWLRPVPGFDVDYRHEDCDGPGDNRCGSAATVAACITEIDELERDNCAPSTGGNSHG